MQRHKCLTVLYQTVFLIAGHARAKGLTLVTNNTRQFSRVEDLFVENWVQE